MSIHVKMLGCYLMDSPVDLYGSTVGSFFVHNVTALEFNNNYNTSLC